MILLLLVYLLSFSSMYYNFCTNNILFSFRSILFFYSYVFIHYFCLVGASVVDMVVDGESVYISTTNSTIYNGTILYQVSASNFELEEYLYVDGYTVSGSLWVGKINHAKRENNNNNVIKTKKHNNRVLFRHYSNETNLYNKFGYYSLPFVDAPPVKYTGISFLFFL